MNQLSLNINLIRFGYINLFLNSAYLLTDILCNVIFDI
uniref:Uncharacterized protein n=1 Tax=Rhizophora mucronata TaxID=61149 RepID=A0A2P2Q3M8_RHIMU